MLFFLLLILAAYLPFQMALSPVPGIDLASIRLFVVGLFLLWLARGLKDKKIRIRADWQTALVAAFLFLNAFSIFFARNAFWSGRKMLFLISIFPVYFVAADILDSREKVKKISAVMVISGAFAALVGIFQFIAQFFFGVGAVYEFWSQHASTIFLGKTFARAVLEYPSWLVNIAGHTYFRAISFFPDPHMLGFFLGLTLPLSVALFFEKYKFRWLVLSGIIFVADILTFSRGSYLGLLVAGIFLFFLFWHRFSRKYKVIFLSGAVFLGMALTFPGPVSSRFFSSFNLQEGSNSGRIEMWRAAGDAIASRPIFGVGLGNFPLAVDPLAGYREPIYAHNTYLDIASETGIPSLLTWAGLLFFSGAAFLKKAKKDRFYLGAFFGLLIFSVHSMVETGLYSPVVLTLFLLLLSFSGDYTIDENTT